MPGLLLDHATDDTQPAASGGAFFGGSADDDPSTTETQIFQCRDGGKLAVEYSANPIFHDGVAVGTVVSFTDISARLADREEHARLERQLRHSQKLETIGTLAGGIAHDFNNILMPIVGYVDMMIPMTKTQPELHDRLQRVAKGAARAADLVRQILTFSRQLEDEDVRDVIQLHGVVNEALKLIRPTVPASILIENLVDTDCPSVLANSTQIHQLIINLCTNAAQAMPDGGTIRIKLAAVDVDDEQAEKGEELQSGPHVLLSVGDDGVGMDEQTLERIFEPFFTTKEIGQGSGLGLSIAHGIVRVHDGYMEVSSEPGRGSEFRIFFPASDGVGFKSAAAVAEMGGKERILFVDDEVMIIEMVEAMLPSIGYQVSCFQSGADALAELRRNNHHYDLVITDLTMPRMNGDQLAEAVQSIQPDLPVIIITGFSNGLSEQRLAELNIHAVLHKPLLRADLDAAIRNALSQGKPDQRLTAQE